jgi:hypothetical protein
MMNSKTIKRLFRTQLINVFVVALSVTTCYGQNKLQDPSPVKTNALALISELESPSNCSPDDTLCLAQITLAKLNAAIAGLKTIVRIDEQREGIIADMQARIDIRGGIIDDLKKVDTNSQRIDVLGVNNLEIMREQHRDDKAMIVDLQKDLASCRSNQKWIFAGGAITGGLVGYKIRGAGTFQNPFLSNGVTSAQLDFLQFASKQTEIEKAIQKALKTPQP